MGLTAHAGVVTVLVVDDEEPIRNALRKFLKQQQFEVYAAASADEALQQLRLHKIALMLSDIRMPGTSGVDLVPRRSRSSPTSPSSCSRPSTTRPAPHSACSAERWTI